jgi:hypothetical protein
MKHATNVLSKGIVEMTPKQFMNIFVSLKGLGVGYVFQMRILMY